MPSESPAHYIAGPALYLASASPRRQALLRQIGVDFQVIAPRVDETRLPEEAVEHFVSRLAAAKARDVFDRLPADYRAVVLGADTVVVCAGQSLGKPRDRQDAFRMLGLLSGGTHRVLTAVAVISRDGREGMLSTTDVSFRDIGQEEMARYWQSGEPKDKAGAYAIQGLGGLFVKHIQGSYSGVVGLPLFETAGLLDRFGIACWQPVEPCPSDQQ